LPKAVNNPIAIFDDKKYGGRAILTELKISDNHVLAALGVGKDKDAKFNIIRSTYGKSLKGIVWWINCGDLLYANKEKALGYLRSPALLAGATDSQEPNLRPLGHSGTPAPIAGAVNDQGPIRTPDRSGTPAPIAGAVNDQELITAINIVKNFANPKLTDT
jgi:hypothetical protein